MAAVNSDSTNKPPYGLYLPASEGKMKWICDYGTDGVTIYGVFACEKDDGTTEKETKQLTLDEANKIYSGLLEAGWKKMEPPKIQYTTTGSSGKKRALNSKERKRLQKQMEKGRLPGDSKDPHRRR